MSRNPQAMSLELFTFTLAAETIAVVPAQALSWHRVQLPAGTFGGGLFKDSSAPPIRAVLEGALEDQLLDEPAQLHFAVQPNPNIDAPVWVAVCDRAWLRDALDTLARQNRAPHRLVPECAPDNASRQVWVTGPEDAPRVLWSDANGLHLLPLPQNADSASEGWAAALESGELWAEPAVAEHAEKLFHRQARIESHAQRLQQAAQTSWNLAQFDLARRNPLLQRLRRAGLTFWTQKRWKPARWAAIVIALIHIIGINVYAWHTQTQLQERRDQIRNTLQATFPQVKVIVDAPVQMERELALLRQARGATSGNDLEAQLSALGVANGNATLTTVPSTLEYNNHELKLGGAP
jgi:general secretion pathway protein L